MYDQYHQQTPPPHLFEDTSTPGYGYQNTRYSQPQYGGGSEGYSQNQQDPNIYPSGIPGSQFIQDPMVANMAMQYGQNLVGQGKEFVNTKIESIVSVSKVKYYFAVDTKYVLKKLKLIFFPFIHSDWSIRYNSEDEEPVQPRYEVNAPDLYIPVMGFITYVIVAGLCLGLQNSFSPDSLGLQASWAVVWLLLELGVIIISFHITAMQTKMHALHILALSSYKYVGMIVCILAGIVLESFGYYCALAYCSLSSVIFMFRTLRCQIQGNVDSSMHGYSAGTKRRFYLMVLISGLQPLMMWWLTRKLIFQRVPDFQHFDP